MPRRKRYKKTTTENAPRIKLEPVPLTIKKANLVVEALHRHHKPTRGGLFAIGCRQQGHSEVCGVAIIGRPLSRFLDDGWTAEVTRMCSDGTAHVCSFLYGLAWRLASSMGYKRLITYTFTSEYGGSCKASNMTPDKVTRDGVTWNSCARPREQNVDLYESKRRWFYGESQYEILEVKIPQKNNGETNVIDNQHDDESD